MRDRLSSFIQQNTVGTAFRRNETIRNNCIHIIILSTGLIEFYQINFEICSLFVYPQIDS